MTGPAVPIREQPIVFRSGRKELYGILTEPAGSGSGVAVVLATGGGLLPMTHRNGLWTRIARRLAADGYPVLRFDWHGTGESTGRVGEYHVDHPFDEDLVAAVQWLEHHRPVSRLLIIGTCFGARSALAAGPRLPSLTAALLLSTPLRGRRRDEAAANKFADTLSLGGYLRRAARGRVVRRLLDPAWRQRYWRIVRVKLDRIAARLIPHQPPADPALPWVSRVFLDPLRSLPVRGVRLHLVYGEADEYYADFRAAMTSELGRVIRRSGGHVTVRVVPGLLHGFTTLEMQQVAVDLACEWVAAASGEPARQAEMAGRVL